MSGTVNFTETIAGALAPTLTLSVPAGTFTYGQSVTVTGTLTPSTSGSNQASGSISVLSNGTPVGSGTVSNGVATVSFMPLAGTDLLTGAYTSTTSSFSSSTTASPLSITVAKLGITGTTSNVTIPYGTPTPAISGTLTGVLAQDTGNVTISFAPTGAATPPAVGSYPLAGTLAGSAAGNYTLTVTGSPQLIVTPAGSNTVLTANPTTIYLGNSTTLTATVSSQVNGGPTPTGTVNFVYNGATIVSGSLRNGVVTATAPANSLPVGVDNVTAVYVTSTNNTTSTSNIVQITVVGPDFTFTFDPSTNLPIPQGGRDYVNLTATPNPIFSGNIVLSCPGIPATFGCSFVSAVLPGPTAPVYTTAVQIASSGSAKTTGQGKSGSALLGTLLFPGMLTLAAFSRKRRKASALWITRVGVLLIALTACYALNGCGNGRTNPASPVGVTMITVTATAVNTGVSHSVTIPVTVTAANN